MSLILSLKTDEALYMACDSASWDGNMIMDRADSKILEIDEYLVGVTGNYRLLYDLSSFLFHIISQLKIIKSQESFGTLSTEIRKYFERKELDKDCEIIFLSKDNHLKIRGTGHIEFPFYNFQVATIGNTHILGYGLYDILGQFLEPHDVLTKIVRLYTKYAINVNGRPIIKKIEL